MFNAWRITLVPQSKKKVAEFRKAVLNEYVYQITDVQKEEEDHNIKVSNENLVYGYLSIKDARTETKMSESKLRSLAQSGQIESDQFIERGKTKLFLVRSSLKDYLEKMEHEKREKEREKQRKEDEKRERKRIKLEKKQQRKKV